MLTRLRSHSRGPGRRRASSSGPQDGSDNPAEDASSAAAAAAAGRRAFGDASNRNSKKGGKSDDGGTKRNGRAAAAAANPTTTVTRTGRTLRNSTTNASTAAASGSRTASASAAASAANATSATASQKTGKRGRVTKVEETERTSRVTRSSSRGRSTKRTRATDDDAAETSSTSAKRAKPSSKRASSKARVKKEATTTVAAASRSTRSSSRTRSRAQDAAAAALVKAEVKSEAESSIVDDVKPRNLADDFLVPPQYRLERSTFDGKNHTLGMAPQDVEEDEDVLKAAPYVADLFQHLYAAEGRDMPTSYMDDQPDINAKMRAILVDWLVEVHMKFRLVPETLYLCVNLIDRYCNLVEVKRSKLQLVGVTALLIACKYEEIYPPEVRDCVYITDRAYNRQDVLDMEQDILEKLGFRITVPTAYPFLLRFLNIVDASELVRFAANYYMERTLQEHDLLEYRPSVVCAAAVVLALNNPSVREDDNETDDPPGMPKVLLEYTGFDEAELSEVAKIISRKVKEEPVTASRRQLIAVKKKFDHDKYRHVSADFDEPSHSDIPRDRKK